MSYDSDFSEKTVVVTGGGSGIGRETAVAFAEGGANVVVGDLDVAGGEETVETITERTDGHGTFVEVNVTDDDDVERLIETATTQYDGLDVAFNNAGIGGTFDATEEISEADWSQIIDVNLTGVWRCLREEIPVMLEDGGGAIINTASILGRVGEAGTPAYTASKHGVVGLTKVAALDHATDDIRVNAVCPGYIETQMLDDAGVTRDEDLLEQTKALHPMKRLGNVEEIAGAVTWLASDAASFVTGETLDVDGGYLSR
ncbi:SDR family NAD(P)-dependent oxidoreductase [Halorubrum sp. DTA98]|uniref:SDR family NAD(P)-dependent oxidoreductase n=1 Tax=Halorubrum sp. DTA98 TaxID=3402163 RepID=UPI003AB08587